MFGHFTTLCMKGLMLQHGFLLSKAADIQLEILLERDSSKNISLRIELNFSEQLLRGACQSDTYPGLPQRSEMKSFVRIVKAAFSGQK